MLGVPGTMRVVLNSSSRALEQTKREKHAVALTFELADPLRQLDDALQRRPLELTTTRWCRRQQR